MKSVEWIREKVRHLPGVGQRILRSVCAVFLCFVVYYLRGQQGIPFYSALAALQCIQPYMEHSAKMARQRVSGTFIGAAWGLAVLLLLTFPGHNIQGTVLSYVLISLITGAVLYSTVLMDNKSASYFSCVVFLSITVNHMTDANPYLFVFNRVMDTMIGVAMAILVNAVHLPREQKRDILFVSDLDEALPPHSQVELNRLIDSGAKFTLSTHWTPATLMETAGGIHLKLPVIVMDGAAIYDIRENSYRMSCALSCEESQRIAALLREHQLNYFANVIIDDLLVIFYETLGNEAEQDIVSRLGRSPYRNFIRRKLPDQEEVVYFMSIAKRAEVERVYHCFQELGLDREFKILVTDSTDYPGYTYMKIFHREVCRERMRKNLLEMLGLEKCITFGCVPGACDILVEDLDKNRMVKLLKNAYEPVRIRRGTHREKKS